MRTTRRNIFNVLLCSIFFSFISIVFFANFELHTQQKEKLKNLAPFVPTPEKVVEKMLKLAKVNKNDIIYDLGCGDGRIVVMAAEKYGARGIGIEIDPDRVSEARERVKKYGVEKLVDIIQKDALKVDLSPATVVTLYLTPEGNELIKPGLEKYLKPGSRVVSHGFTMRGWKPKETEYVYVKAPYIQSTLTGLEEHTIYLWIIGEQKEEK